VRTVAGHNRNVAAVMVEPIQGEGGINVSRLEYLRGLKEICDQQPLAVHLGRGAVRAGAHREMVRLPARRLSPDVVPLAKGLGSGFRSAPACRRTRQRAFQARQPWLDLRRNPLAMTRS